MTTIRARRAAALEFWAGLCLLLGAGLPWFSYGSRAGTLDQSGTNVLWGALPFFGGWFLVVAATTHVLTKAPVNRRLLAWVTTLGVVALAGAVLVAIPMDTERGLTFRSVHIGFVVSVVGILLGVTSLVMSKRT